jgi:hypothetical protein
MIRRQDILAGGLAVLALGAMVFAALMPRLTGTVEMSLSGFKMELVKLTEIGRLANYSEEEILAAIEYKLRAESSVLSSVTPEKNIKSSYIGGTSVTLDGSDKPSTEDPLGRVLRALAHGTPSSPKQAEQYWALAMEILIGQRASRDGVAVINAFKLARNALAAMPQDSPEYPKAVTQLAKALRFRYPALKDETNRVEIAALLTELENARRQRAS